MWLRRSRKSHGPKTIITFRHNLLPVLLGIFVFGGVLFALNSQWILAQATYHFSRQVQAPTPHQINVANTKAPNNNSELFIPSINVDAPINTDITTYADWAVQIGLRSGVVHYGKTALPGQKGNMVIVGHSSEVAWAPGNYKFVFTLLNKVKTGDLIYIDYQGTRYTYQVTGSEVVDPTDFNVIQSTADPELTLITCTPVGTDWHRLAVHAKQISPDPSKDATMPGSITATSGNLPI